MSEQGPAFELVHSIVKAVDYRDTYAPPGGTVALNGLPLPTAGYFVGGASEELVYPSFVEFNGREAARFVQSATAPYVGWWVDEETGKIHIDAVDWFQEESAAVAVGRVRGEIAIWDVANEREIRIPYASDGE